MKIDDLKAEAIRARPSSGGNTREWYRLPTGGYIEAIQLRKLLRALPAGTSIETTDRGVLLTYHRGWILLTGLPGFRLVDRTGRRLDVQKA